jgi:ABC-2 type transport system permease protein
LTFAITFVTQLLMVLFGMMRMGSALLSHLGLFSMWWGEFFHIVAFHGLWWAPFWGWFLMASAWSRRAPLLWATLPPLAIAFAERIAFGTTYFSQWLMFRFVGGMQASDSPPMSSGSLMTMTPLQFLTDIHLWTGFALCAAFIAVAIRLRRVRGQM